MPTRPDGSRIAPFRLCILGGAALERDGAAVGDIRAQRKMLALLALLAMAGQRGISRDRLTAYLWPESDARHASGALKQALHVVRQLLGAPEAVVGTTQLRLDSALIESDVDAFLAALEAGDLKRAVALYAGPFLDGFHLPDAPEFERWVQIQRDALASRHAAAVEQSAVDAGSRGDHAAAVDWWRTLQARDPLGGRFTLGLMQALESAGDRAAALRTARAHEQLLHDELGSPPDAGVAAFAARLRQESALDAQHALRDSTDENPPIDRGTRDAEAYELYLQARHSWRLRTPDGFSAARKYYEAAVERDAGFARAWAGLAEAYVNLGNFGYLGLLEALALAEKAADRAIELDPRAGAAHAAKGFVLASRLEFVEAEAALRTSITQSPDYTWGYHYYTLLLMMLGRTDEARERNREALLVDPLSRPASTTRGIILCQEAEYHRAANDLQRALALAPEFPLTLYYLGVVRIAQEAWHDALTLLERAARQAPSFTGVPGALAYLYRRAGRLEEADACVARLRQPAPDDRTAANLAFALGALGELDDAFALMDRLRWDMPSVIELRADPLLGALRGDVRYARLLQRIGA